MLYQGALIEATENSKSVWYPSLDQVGMLEIGLALLEGGSEQKAKLCVAKFFLLFKMEVRGSEEELEFALVQNTENGLPRDDVDKGLGSACQQWSTDDKQITH